MICDVDDVALHQSKWDEMGGDYGGHCLWHVVIGLMEVATFCLGRSNGEMKSTRRRFCAWLPMTYIQLTLCDGDLEANSSMVLGSRRRHNILMVRLYMLLQTSLAME